MPDGNLPRRTGPSEDLMENESFLCELWDDQLRPFFLHFIPDFVKSLSILAGLYVFWEAIALLRFRGYPDDLCQSLEKTHFAFMWIALSVTSLNFVLKQVFALWKKCVGSTGNGEITFSVSE
jgi:hypothetical protein